MTQTEAVFHRYSSKWMFFNFLMVTLGEGVVKQRQMGTGGRRVK